jgi:D-arabinose 1-dehydrogenase-like Zn-dependent alcohol dehydrogenase
MDELLEMALAGDVVPILEVFLFEMLNELLQKLAKSQIPGRVVLKIPQ